MRIHPVFHNSLLKPYTETSAHGPNFARPPLEIIGGEEGHYKNEKILQARPTRNKKSTQYLVKWKGYLDSENSWLPAKELTHAQELVHDFQTKQTSKEGIWTLQAQGKPKEGILSQPKPAPSHTPANACTSPVVPTLKPSYSQVTRLGIRACDPGKQHMIGAHDRPRDLQVLWGSRDLRACDPVKKTGDPLSNWSATRSGDHRYMMRPLNHPVRTTNGGVRINKVI